MGLRAVYIQLESQKRRGKGPMVREGANTGNSRHDVISTRHKEAASHRCSRPGLKRASQITCCITLQAKCLMQGTISMQIRVISSMLPTSSGLRERPTTPRHATSWLAAPPRLNLSFTMRQSNTNKAANIAIFEIAATFTCSS